MQSLLVNELGKETKLIKKNKQFVYFMFGDFQLLDLLNFLGGAMGLDFFMKARKTLVAKILFTYEWFDCPEKLNDTQLPPWEPFLAYYATKIISKNSHSGFQSSIDGSLTSEEEAQTEATPCNCSEELSILD